MRCSLVLLLAACSEYSLEKDADGAGGAQPAIEVEPTRLDFWDVGAGETEILSFDVRNVGEATLTVSGVSAPALADFALIYDGGSFLLEPGDSATVDVAFTPTVAEERTDAVVVASDDPARPAVPVELVGEGRLPWLVVDPERHDFGAVEIPCPADREFVLQNVGAEDLEVAALALTGDDQLAIAEGPGTPFTLPPGAYTTVRVALAPVREGDVAASLEVTSNDPRGVVTAEIAAAPAWAGSAEDVFAVEDAPPVDVLFAVDQSGSMDDDAVSLADNFAAFVAAVEAETEGWQAGVATYDDGCFNGGVLSTATNDLAGTVATATTLGDDREIVDDEALFQIVDRALDQTGAGGCNEGFLRAGALLHVIVVSDEPERSPEQASAWTWDWWVSAFEAHVSAPSRLRVSGVVDVDGCGEGAENYAEAIAATGGEALSICSGDWAAHVAALASATTAGLWSYPLSGTPDPTTLVVAVDGVAIATGWTWDAAGNAVVFDARPAGGEVVVRYSLAGSCE